MIEFSLPLKAFSVNSFHYATRRVKTVEARQWEQCFLEYLEDHRKALNEMADDFREKGGAFRIKVTCVYPAFIYYNKSKTISSKTLDVDNVLKPILDLIFGSMDINDKYCIECTSAKKAGTSYEIKIQLQLLPQDSD